MPSPHYYAQRIREEAQRALTPHLRSLEIELESLHSYLSASLARLAQKLESSQKIELSTAEALLAEAMQEISREKDEGISFLARFAREVRQKETQEESLNLLMDAALKFAPCVALFVVRSDQLLGWSSRGYPAQFARKIPSISCSRAESPLLGRVLETEGVASVDDPLDESLLQQLLQGDANGPWHFFPLKAIERPVAVLLVAAQGQACDLASLNLIVDLTSLWIENTALKVLEDVKRLAPPALAEPPHEPAAPVEEVVLAQAEAPVSEPVIEAGAPEVAPAEPIPAEALAAPVPSQPEQAIPEAVSILIEQEPAAIVEPLPSAPPVTFEETSVEPLETAKPERLLPTTVPEIVPGLFPPQLAVPTEPPPAMPVPEIPVPPTPPGIERAAEEEKLHSDAKRFARLLVTEIKLYNEYRVVEGRKNRDLYVRLKRDIDRSREMYEKRVSPAVSRKVDYLHDEIVRILGDNDPSTLGSDYTGPRLGS